MRIKRRRNYIRAISYTAAALAITIGLSVTYGMRAQKMRMSIEYSYQRALSELSVHLDNINVDLEKARYAGTTSQLIGLSSKIKNDANEAADALSQMSVSNVNLESTSKFIAQTGDYANQIAKMASEKVEITEKERQNFDSLYDNSKKLSEEVSNILSEVQAGRITLYKMEKADDAFDNQKTQQVSALASGFQNIEENSAGLPTLIYDGPFSDNMLKKTPEVTKSLKTVDRAAAKQKAAKFLGVDAAKLTDDGESGGSLPTYNFKVGTRNINVSKKGGLVVRMVDSRIPKSSKLTKEQAMAKIDAFFKTQDIKSMKSTYFLTAKNICTVNYAYMQGDITCYTDLVKVGVALDNGEIASYDATGYIMNHKERTMPKLSYNKADAQKNVSSLLKVNNTSLALIPVNGTGEALCYEFKCKDEKLGRNVIDYYNVTNGNEEEILILLQTDGGTLTM